MSNQAAAIVVLPIALQTAYQLDLNPRAFRDDDRVRRELLVLTPLEPSCIMVYGAGRYRFADFLKVGSLLTLIIYVIVIYARADRLAVARAGALRLRRARGGGLRHARTEWSRLHRASRCASPR